MKVLSPTTYYLIRGNYKNSYGFKEEILNYHDPKKSTNPPIQKSSHHTDQESQDEYIGYDMNCYKYSEKLYDAFMQAFAFLPIGAILNNTTFCIHGGISPKLGHVDYINSLIQRPITNFEDSPLLSDLVWSDPSHSSKQFEENLRGRGYLFNRESIINFLNKCNLTRVVRGHQCVKNGIQKNFNDKCITVFSASSYDKTAENSSAILKLFQCTDSISCQTFSPLPRLQKSDSSYYKVQPLNPSIKRVKTCFSFLHPQLHSVGSLRMSSSCSITQIKTQRTEDSLHHQCLNSKMAPIVKPRFITNSKKSSMSFVQRPKSFLASSSLSVFDEYKKQPRKCELESLAENKF